MKINLKPLATAGAAALAAFGAAPAFAAGTTAGTNISNAATVGYSVGGVTQTAIVSAAVAFVVDRKISMLVVEADTSTTQVVPGQTAAVTTFIVTNTSNDALDLGLTATQITGGTAVHGGTDNFDVTGGKLYLDNGNGVYNVGIDVEVTYLDEVPVESPRTVFYVANVSASQTNGQVAGVTLTAQARVAAGTTGVQGAVYLATAGANTNGTVDNVFADSLSGVTGDLANDGQYSGRDDYTVSAPVLTVVKTSKIISDGFNTGANLVNAKLIPGAVVEYCIAVTNAAGAANAAASTITVTDPVSTDMTYDTAFGAFVNATVTSGVCSAGTAVPSAFSAGTVTGTFTSTLPANTTTGLYYRATIK